MFHGSMVALVTPMTVSGEIDESALRRLVEHHITQGTKALIINGTTGEAPTLNLEEQLKTVGIALEVACGRIPIIAGTGTYSTADTQRRSELMMAKGVDACLIVTPYYNRPTQKGLYQHYKTIAENVPIPIIMYNAPNRTGCDLLPETVARLSDIPNIIGLKECVEGRIKALISACGDKIDFFTGEDASALAFMLQGGKGVISVTANVAPKEMNEMCEAALNKDFELAGAINARLMPLHKNLFLESNPIPVKWALNQLGWIEAGIRLPLTPLSEKHHDPIREALIHAGLLNATNVV